MLEVAELTSRREEDRMGLGFPIETRNKLHTICYSSRSKEPLIHADEESRTHTDTAFYKHNCLFF